MTDQDKVNYIFAALARSKVSIKHMAPLSQTTRVTLHKWKAGAKGFDSMRVQVAFGVARRLVKACETGQLPLQGVKAKEKLQVLRAIVKGVVL